MAERGHKHLEKNKIFPLEQKRCRKGLYGCKDQQGKQNDYGEYEKKSPESKYSLD